MQLWNGTTTHPAELVGFPSVDVIAEDPRTDMEKRLSWICDEWADAAANDMHEEWHDLNMMLHGALQGLNHCPDRHHDRMAIMEISKLAFRHSIDCIHAGRMSK